MSNPIGWCTKTWNPITGCSKVSPACEHCHAERMAGRNLASTKCPTCHGRGGWQYGEPPIEPGGNGTLEWEPCRDCDATGNRGFRVTFHPNRLDTPLHWRKPSRIFVCSMGDLFHEDVPDEWISRVFYTMAMAPQHTFLLLTKRPERVRFFMDIQAIGDDGQVQRQKHPTLAGQPWPLPNVWMGTTVENQWAVNTRIPELLDTPAAKRFVSCEPLLGPVDLTRYGIRQGKRGSTHISHLSQVICGGETGPAARPMHPDWVRSLRDQCQAAGVPFWFKGWGEWMPSPALPVRGKYTGGGIFLRPDGVWGNQGEWWDGTAAAMDRVGKKTAGCLLDGREHKEAPHA